MLDAWTEMGGFLALRHRQRDLVLPHGPRLRTTSSAHIWPATIYPSGKVEVVFQHLSTRTPFDDVALREEFRQRLNTGAGRGDRRRQARSPPGFPLTVLVDPGARRTLVEHLGWFHERAQTDDPDR